MCLVCFPRIMTSSVKERPKFLPVLRADFEKMTSSFITTETIIVFLRLVIYLKGLDL